MIGRRRPTSDLYVCTTSQGRRTDVMIGRRRPTSQGRHLEFTVLRRRRRNKTSLGPVHDVLTTSLEFLAGNVSARSQTDQPPVSSLIQQRRLKLFGHIARAAASEDHSRALRASTDRLPVDWRRPRGRPRQSWLRTIDSDLKPFNLGFHSTLRRATDRPSIVETAMLFERATRW